MIRLPTTLPKALHKALAPALSSSDLSRALCDSSAAIMGLFEAKKAVCVLEYKNEKGIQRLSHALGKDFRYTPSEEQMILNAIFDCGMHSQILQVLGQKLASVSYSAFSWPFRRVEMRSKDEEKSFILPQEYSLFLPFSSRQVVASDDDYLFEGYLGLLFDEFPKLNELEIQLIVELPELLSDIARSYLDQQRRKESDSLPLFAHDIKRDILINREFLRVAEESSGSKSAKALGGIKRSLLRMLGDTDAVLLAAKEERGDLRISPMLLNINDLVQDVVEEMKPLFAHAHVKLRVELAGYLDPIPVDPAIFPSALFNLMDNALKYSDPGSEVVVCTKLSPHDRCLLEVLDSARPIPQEDRELIFEKRKRGRNSEGTSGSGYGLYLAKKVVEAHGCSLRLEESVGATKRFVIEFPSMQNSSAVEDESLGV